LGFTFSNKLGLAASNKNTVTEKINNTIRFWNTFGLSIAGKVTVAKSLILPLFNYYACVLNFDTETLETLENKIEKFVTSGINISKEKIYGSIESGGLNLFKLDVFSMTMQVSWIKRAMDLQHDNWRSLLRGLNPLGLCSVTRFDSARCGPVLKGIVDNFINFRTSYGTVRNNFLAVPILYNDHFFFYRNREKTKFTYDFFSNPGGDAVQNHVLDDLTWDRISHNAILNSRENINNNLNLQLGVDSYNDLRAAFERAKKKIFFQIRIVLYSYRTFSKWLKEDPKNSG
jgi:hypothetical protein